MAWLDSPNSLTETVSRVAQVKSIGLDVGIDFHGRLHKPMAKQLAKLLEPLQPLFIEGMCMLSLKLPYCQNTFPRVLVRFFHHYPGYVTNVAIYLPYSLVSAIFRN